MKHFIDDTNTLTSKLLKDQQVKYGVSTEQSNVLRLLTVMQQSHFLLIFLYDDLLPLY
jgi:hypothetical protein